MTGKEKVAGVIARRIEEKLNGLEVATANLMQNIAYARAELIRKADEYEEQIEKLKCCGNCKHEQDSNTNYYCEDCKRFANETGIDKWEYGE